MPQITTSSGLIGLILGAALALSGCGDRNSKAAYAPDSGRHLAGWLPSGHKSAARSNLDSCVDCHGTNLDGGISKVSCTLCHLGGGTGSVHPLEWGQFAYARHENYVIANGAAACATAFCHGTTLAGASGPACATACHLGGAAAVHPADWTVSNAQGVQFPARHADFVTANGGYDASSCSNAACHGADFRGVFLTGPSCYQCHQADPTDPAPLPDQHPRRFAAAWLDGAPATPGFHGNYLQTVLNSDASSCLTNICHGGGNANAPSCSTPSFTVNGVLRSCHQ